MPGPYTDNRQSVTSEDNNAAWLRGYGRGMPSTLRIGSAAGRVDTADCVDQVDTVDAAAKPQPDGRRGPTLHAPW